MAGGGAGVWLQRCWRKSGQLDLGVKCTQVNDPDHLLRRISERKYALSSCCQGLCVVVAGALGGRRGECDFGSILPIFIHY